MMMKDTQKTWTDAPTLVERLCAEIESAWDEQRDWTVTPRLAAEYPAVADVLYDFFEVLIEGTVDDVLRASSGPAIEKRRPQRESSAPNASDIWHWYQQVGRSVAETAEQAARRQHMATESPPTAVPSQPDHSTVDSPLQGSAVTRHAPSVQGGSPAKGDGSLTIGPSDGPPRRVVQSGGSQRVPNAGASSDDAPGPSPPAHAPAKPLLGYLRDETGESAQTIGREIEVPFVLLTLVSRYPEAIPQGWSRYIRQKIGGRFGRGTADGAPIGIPHVLRGGYPVAASRHAAYSSEPVTWEVILRRACLPVEEDAHWRRLAAQSDRPDEHSGVDDEV
jgi:hypothetical protein